jgi:di/tricarboxylate transporter
VKPGSNEYPLDTTKHALLIHNCFLFYFFADYLLASQTAHIAALYAPFLSAMIAAGVPPRLGALTLAFSSNLMGGGCLITPLWSAFASFPIQK